MPNAMKRLLKREVKLTYLDLKVARPSSPELVGDGWSHQVMELLAGAGGVNLHIEINARARDEKSSKGNYLDSRLKRAINQLIDSSPVKQARLKVEEDDAQYPIDLLEDRLSSELKVHMNGRYPITAEIFSGLQKAYVQAKPTLIQIFGEDNNRLR